MHTPKYSADLGTPGKGQLSRCLMSLNVLVDDLHLGVRETRVLMPALSMSNTWAAPVQVFVHAVPLTKHSPDRPPDEKNNDSSFKPMSC